MVMMVRVLVDGDDGSGDDDDGVGGDGRAGG